ncbi:uncharacterized protein [Chelonus insularis]|uniref:uncharacterized protein n=1 Tax=Chelonus insularis TaxID=460826 RepID=UPI00158AEACC|nr:uncharacterized protein LOC118071510 [Chelonus insularis]
MKFVSIITQLIISMLLFSNIFGDSSRILPNSSWKNLTLTERMLILLLGICNLGFKNTIYYTGNHSDLTEDLLKMSSSKNPKSWILTSTTGYTKFRNLTTINGYVIVFSESEELVKIIWRIMLNWQCVKTCKVIFLSKVPRSCDHARDAIARLGHAYYEVIYYICDDKKYGPIVLTQDKYQNIQQPYWTHVSWKVDSLYLGSFYLRKYNIDLCRNLNFYRQMPSENIDILVGCQRKVTSESEMVPDFIYREDMNKLKTEFLLPSILLIGKVLNITFAAYIQSYLYKKGHNADKLYPLLWIKTHVDITSHGQALVYNNLITYLNPDYYDTFIILSFKSAEATPLEKIYKFYGIWTLISLIMILIITFVVIYLKSHRNAASAAFNVLRLLINSGVEIPINTLSLKIFFCMIFLYFTVIHATFSENLPRFLTIPEIHDTIDSLEDLLNPRITTIYDIGFYNDDNKLTNEVINRKRKYLRDPYDLIQHFIADKTSVCIINKKDSVFVFKLKGFLGKIHMSKNEFGDIKGGLIVRRRFFLQEQFQWATTYLFDVAVHTLYKKEHYKIERSIEKHQILSQINFRKITLNDLRFSFIFLIIGNTFGLVCFFIELTISKKYHRKIRLYFLKKYMTFKRKKARNNIRRIVVKPKPLKPELIN